MIEVRCDICGKCKVFESVIKAVDDGWIFTGAWVCMDCQKCEELGQ